MSVEDKKVRGQKKALVTRAMNSIDRYAVEDNEAKVKENVERVMTAFDEFEQAHLKYHALLEDDALVEDSDGYFDKALKEYVAKMKYAKDWLKDRNGGDVNSVKDEKPSDSIQAQQHFMAMMNMPKVDIEKFDGNPLTYHSFIALFDEAVDSVPTSNRAKLTRLIECTKGDAKNAIRSCILQKSDGAYQDAKDILACRFGSDHLVTERMVQNLRSGGRVTSPEALRQLADELRTCEKTLSQMGTLAEVESQKCITDIVLRLELKLQDRWVTRATKMKRTTKMYPKFKEFVEFVIVAAEDSNDPVYGHIGSRAKHVPKQSTKTTTSFSAGAVGPSISNTTKRAPRRCVLCSGDHRLLYCQEFKRMSVVARLKIVADKSLCNVCLLDNHRTVDCKKQYKCTISDCGERHSKFLHLNQSSGNASNVNLLANTGAESSDEMGLDVCDSVVNDQKGNVSENFEANVSTAVNVHLPVVSVRINDTVIVNALLDTGSSSSFCSADLANQLNLDCDSTKYRLSTLHGSNEQVTSIVSFRAASLDGHRSLNMSNVFVVENIPVQTYSVDVAAYPHLEGMTFTPGHEKVQLLIGQDYSEALIPLDVRRGGFADPFAVRTLFGWSVNGPLRCVDNVGSGAVSHFVNVSLEERVNNMWNIENECIVDENSWSKNDHEVIGLWESSVTKVDGHYQLPIPWKPGACLPNNLSMAKSRLKSLCRNLERKGLYSKYDDEIKKLLVEGYAEPVPDSESAKNEVWYLPHQVVVSDSKPGKIRIVFDCAAKFLGESLNDKCYQGPDLCNKLLHVLLRFRQHEIAIMADVKAMYYQVVIPPKDRDALRFLWFDTSGQVCHFRMTRHVFGGVWCSASSTFALRRVLCDGPDVDPLVADTVRQSFYVDDCLRSVSSVEDGHTVIAGTRSVLQEGGFKLTKFIANNVELMSAVPLEDRAAEAADVEFVKDSKVLGVKWNVREDKFHFNVKVNDSREVTRRSILSIVSSMYDPLGLVSPIVLVGRLIFQEATRAKLGWDDPVPSHIERRWRSWIQDLSDIDQLGIPRCVVSGDVSDMVLEIHNFSDASMNAYGFCSYLRAIDKQGTVQTCLLMAKSRVAPLKSVTIPRLELLAAVMAAQADALLRRELDFNIVRSYFWTDSEIVLKYILNESQRFHVFVSNRLSQIRQLTKPDQWGHVSGKCNPADVASRGTSVSSLNVDQWCKGPKFLRSYKSEWEVESCDPVLPVGDPEVKVMCNLIAADGADHPIDRLSSHYSSWYGLKHAVAWLLRLKGILRHKIRSDQSKLSVQEIQDAELVIVKRAQLQSYGKEVASLSSGSPVSRSSPLISLDPVLDPEGRLIVGGRLKSADVSEQSKHPTIIPFDHPVSRLIVQEEHDKAHLGVEWVIANVRRRYWITRIRRLAKGIAHKCVKCKRLFAEPLFQKMGDHIPERLESGKPPFTYTGMDCFGPFMVKLGRAQVKRYGCIFSCLNTRAVHIEVLYSMDTDSLINGFRRFVGRRGFPAKVWTDQGTNFVGSNTELKNALSEIDPDQLHSYGVKLNVEWHFNAPCASHKGGLWERMIRIIRKVFAGLSDINCKMSDETLQTLMCEVEAIINGRPITKSREDVNDLTALTPNHLLLLREQPNLSPGQFANADLYKRRWRCVQHLAQEFWRRWLLEYLPELQRRQKWMSEVRSVQIGDLVLIKSEVTPRGVWPMGLVTEIKHSSDGLVRTVTVKTRSTHLVRPVTKIVLLEGVV